MFEQERQVTASRALIAAGDRPVFHVVTSWDGTAVDVRVQELPLIHLFVPDSAGVADGARTLIARTLGVDPSAFTLRAAP
jgi:hypothetical protein